MKLKTAIMTSALIALLGLTQNVSAEEVVLDSTAAIVNNSIILESELESQVRRIKSGYASRNVSVDDLTVRKQALESLITRALILEIAQNQGADISDMQIDNAIEQTAVRTNASKEKILESYGDDLTKAQARDRFRDDFLINEIRRSAVRQRIHILEAEVDTLAKVLKDKGGVEPQYHIAQVTIPLSTTPTEAQFNSAQAQARNIISQLRNGANVEEIGAHYNNAGQPTDLGYVPETGIPLPFVPAIVKSHPGDVVGPFRSASGFHVIKVIDISQNAVAPIKTYDAAHILVKTSIIFDDAAAKAKLLDIKSNIKSGKTTFAKAAKEFSEDPGSAVNGGDLGYATPDRYDPAFAAAMVSLNVGQISDPVKSTFGWHIIYLKDTKVDRDSMDAFKEKARNIIFEREFNEASAQWERNLREMAYIHVSDEQLLKAGYNKDKKE